MKKAIAMKWIQALRSGKYAQTQGVLKDDDGFCCLGVLCDISKKGKWSDAGYYIDSEFDLPYEVMDWAGMKDNVGNEFSYGREKMKMTLPMLNDDEKLSFNQIANFIERRYEEL